mmetsp:Transcript_17216/g.43214  ORF Transcript_17216/g.43214 Transcript_17216/m.43214 type:complete len:228 (+) Transcript_17216:1531-2214(+)
MSRGALAWQPSTQQHGRHSKREGPLVCQPGQPLQLLCLVYNPLLNHSLLNLLHKWQQACLPPCRQCMPSRRRGHRPRQARGHRLHACQSLQHTHLCQTSWLFLQRCSWLRKSSKGKPLLLPLGQQRVKTSCSWHQGSWLQGKEAWGQGLCSCVMVCRVANRCSALRCRHSSLQPIHHVPSNQAACGQQRSRHGSGHHQMRRHGHCMLGVVERCMASMQPCLARHSQT